MRLGFTASCLWAAFLFFVSVGVSPAAAAKPQKVKVKKQVEVLPKAHIALDLVSGRVLLASNASQSLAPASLTKMLTAYVVLQAVAEKKISLETMVIVSKNAASQEGSRLGLVEGELVSVKVLLEGLMAISGNDCAIALAEHFGYEAFIALMNETANKLGLENSRFANPSGLPEANHFSNALDLGKLARRLVLDFPDSAALYSIAQYSYKGEAQSNRNPLLGQANVYGLKTGHIKAAGYHLATWLQESYQNQSASYPFGIVAVTLGSATPAERKREAQELLTKTQANFAPRLVGTANSIQAKATYAEAVNPAVNLVLKNTFWVIAPKNATLSIKTELLPTAPPFDSTAPQGRLTVKWRNEFTGQNESANAPLYSQNDVKRAAWLTITWRNLIGK